MPSMRPQPSSPRKTPAAPSPPPESAEPPLTKEEKRARAGGFHESSYELRTGLDMLETEWPDDTTIPGPLDDT